MKLRNATIVLLLCALAVATAPGKPKKNTVSAVFQNARYIYVQSVDGDSLNPNLYPEDRQAIFDVEERLRDWKRYTVTIRREDADLVFIVRKGRTAAARTRIGVAGGARTRSGPYSGNAPATDPSQYPAQGSGTGTGPLGNGTAVGVGGEVGPSDDLLRIFSSAPDGKLIGPVWSRELDAGLDGPSVELMRQLQNEVDSAYPVTKGGAPGTSGTAQPQPAAPPQPKPQESPQPQSPQPTPSPQPQSQK